MTMMCKEDSLPVESSTLNNGTHAPALPSWLKIAIPTDDDLDDSTMKSMSADDADLFATTIAAHNSASRSLRETEATLVETEAAETDVAPRQVASATASSSSSSPTLATTPVTHIDSSALAIETTTTTATTTVEENHTPTAKQLPSPSSSHQTMICVQDISDPGDVQERLEQAFAKDTDTNGETAMVSLLLRRCDAQAVWEDVDCCPWRRLSQLTLSHCHLTDATVELLCEALEDVYSDSELFGTGNIPLQTLDVSHNAIGDVGACALAEYDWTQSLTALHVTHNAVRDLGAEALVQWLLADAVESDDSENDCGNEPAILKTLVCHDNLFGQRGMALLEEAAESGAQLIWNLDETLDEPAEVTPEQSEQQFHNPLSSTTSFDVTEDTTSETYTTTDSFVLEDQNNTGWMTSTSTPSSLSPTTPSLNARRTTPNRQSSRLPDTSTDQNYGFEALLEKFQNTPMGGNIFNASWVNADFDMLSLENVECSLEQAFVRLLRQDDSLVCIDIELDERRAQQDYAHTLCLHLIPSVQELCICHSNLTSFGHAAHPTMDANHSGIIPTKGIESSTSVYRHLRILDLGSNKLGDDGVVALCNHWSAFASLKFLNLPDNGVGDVGACALADVVRTSAALVAAEVSAEDDHTTLSPMQEQQQGSSTKPKKRTGLQSLCVCENDIGDRGAMALAQLDLEYLFCWDNVFEYDGKEAMEKSSSEFVYWARPYHWEDELGISRSKALMEEETMLEHHKKSIQLVNTKPVLPTSPEYKNARQLLEERYVSMRQQFLNGGAARAKKKALIKKRTVIPNAPAFRAAQAMLEELYPDMRDAIAKGTSPGQKLPIPEPAPKSSRRSRGRIPRTPLSPEKKKVGDKIQFGESCRPRKGTDKKKSLSALQYRIQAEPVSIDDEEQGEEMPQKNRVSVSHRPKSSRRSTRKAPSLRRQLSQDQQQRANARRRSQEPAKRRVSVEPSRRLELYDSVARSKQKSPRADTSAGSEPPRKQKSGFLRALAHMRDKERDKSLAHQMV